MCTITYCSLLNVKKFNILTFKAKILGQNNRRKKKRISGIKHDGSHKLHVPQNWCTFDYACKC